MKQTIKFSDYKNDLITMIKQAKNEYNNIPEAAAILSANNLRYNIKTGQTLNNSGVISEHCNKKDIPQYENIKEVFIWELLNYFKNECVRIDYFKKTNQKYFY
jgi:hypothetical protein